MLPDAQEAVRTSAAVKAAMRGGAIGLSILSEQIVQLLSAPPPQASSSTTSVTSTTTRTARPARPEVHQQLLNPHNQRCLLVLLSHVCACISPAGGVVAMTSLQHVSGAVRSAVSSHAGICQGLEAAQLLLACSRCQAAMVHMCQQKEEGMRFVASTYMSGAVGYFAEPTTMRQLLKGESRA